MGDAFNPYSHWLGLAPQRWKPTYYEILGIDRSAKDKDAIIAAGKKLYFEVKAAPLEGKEKEHQALLAEIEAAVRTFASTTRRAEYDSHLEPHVGDNLAETKILSDVPTVLATPKVPLGAVESAKEPPAPRAAAAAFVMPPMAAAPAATPLVARPIVRVAEKGGTPGLAVRTEGAKSMAAITAERHRKSQQRQKSILLAFSAGGLVLVLGLGLMFREQIRLALASEKPKPVEEEPVKNSIEKIVGSKKPEETAETEPVIPADDPNVNQNPEENSKPPEASPNAPEMAAPPEMKPEMKPETPPEVKPAPAPLTAEEAAMLKTHCEEVVSAVKSRDLAKAAAELEKAEGLARQEAAKEKVQKLAGVVGPLGAFWNALDEAWKSLKTGDEITVGGSTKVKVIAIAEDEIEIETAAGKRKQKRDQLPAGLLLGLVRTKLDLASPEGKLALGVYHLVDEAGNAADGEKLLAGGSLDAQGVKAALAGPFDFSSLVAGEEAKPAMEGEAASSEPIQKLRAALKSRELDEAAKLAAELEKEAAKPDAAPNLAAEAALAQYGSEFWKVVASGIASFQGTEEISIGGEVVVVIEARKDRLVCRYRGMRKEFSLKTIPADLAMAIAEMKSDKESPGFLLAKGAMLLTSEKPDAQGAKEAWMKAKSLGAESADLLLTLAQ